MTRPDTHETYIAAAPEQLRDILGQLREQLPRALPNAEEVIKYDMLGFQIQNTMIVGYAAFGKRCGLCFDLGTVVAHADKMGSSKPKPGETGVTFSASKPVADDLVQKLAPTSRSQKEP